MHFEGVECTCLSVFQIHCNFPADSGIKEDFRSAGYIGLAKFSYLTTQFVGSGSQLSRVFKPRTRPYLPWVPEVIFLFRLAKPRSRGTKCQEEKITTYCPVLVWRGEGEGGGEGVIILGLTFL